MAPSEVPLHKHLATATALVVVLPALLSGCGGDDNPLSSSGSSSGDRPLSGSSSRPSSSSSPSSSPEASAGPSSSSTPTVGSPIGSSTTGIVVRGNGFTIRLPGDPEKSNASAKGNITFDIYRYEAPDAIYTVTRGSYPKMGTLPLLKEALDSAAGQAGGKVATSKTFKYKHQPTIEGSISGVELDGKEVYIFARYVVVNRVMYGLLFVDKGGSSSSNAAFKTFVESLTF